MVTKIYYIYILECSNGALYTGYTTDLERRYREHRQGTTKCKYTRSFPPKKISASWQIDGDISSVLKIERYIKTLTATEKALLVAQPERFEVIRNKLVR